MQGHKHHGKNRADADHILNHGLGRLAKNIYSFFHHGLVPVVLFLFRINLVPYLFFSIKNFMRTFANKNINPLKSNE